MVSIDTKSSPARADFLGTSSHGSNERKTTATSRRRPFRPRSVTSLTEEQLQRKRANDRDSQRAIRQRTKSTIEGLQRAVFDLECQHMARENLIPELQLRIRQLEQEKSSLCNRLHTLTKNLHVPATTEHIRRKSANLHDAIHSTKAEHSKSYRRESTATTYTHIMGTASQDAQTVSCAAQPGLATAATAEDALSGAANACTSTEQFRAWKGFDTVVKVQPPMDNLPKEATTNGLHNDGSTWSGNNIQQRQQQHNSNATASFASDSSNTLSYSNLSVSPVSAGLASAFHYPMQCGELNFPQTMGCPISSVFSSVTDTSAYPFHGGHLQTLPFVPQIRPPNEPLKCTSTSMPLAEQDHDGCACRIYQATHSATN